jgi:hypothetical protein
MRRQLALLLAAGLVVLAGCGSSGPPPIEDPKEIVVKGVEALQGTKSVHVRVDVSGEAPLDLTGAGSGANAIPLDGTTIEGDIDIANKKLDLTFAIPPLLGLTGDILVVDDAAYIRVPLLGPKWIKQSATGSTGEVVDTASDPQKALEDIKKALDDPRVAPKKLADEKCGTKDCYHVQMTIPTDALAGEVAGALGSAVPLPSGAALPSGSPDATVDVWVEKDTMKIAKVTIDAAMDAATIKATIAFSKWDEPVTVEAPPPDQVDESGGGLLPGLLPSFGLESPQPSP